MNDVAHLDCPCCGEPGIPEGRRSPEVDGPCWWVGDRATCSTCGCVLEVEEAGEDNDDNPICAARVLEGCAGWEGTP